MVEQEDLSTDVIRGIAAELESLWEAHRSSGWVTSAKHPVEVGPLIFGYVSQAHEFARSVFALERSGQILSAVPLARAVMEFAMTAAWLSASPSAARDVIWEGDRARRKALEEINLTGIVDVAEALAEQEAQLAGREGRPAREAQYFRDRCTALENGQAMYAHYRVLSSYCHPGARSADSWLIAQPPGSNPPIRFRAAPAPLDAEPILGTAACMMLLAQRAADDIQVEPRHREQLRALAARLGISAEIRLVGT